MSDPLRLPFTLLKIEPFAADLCQTLSPTAFYKAQILKQICWCFAHKVDRAEAFVRCVKQMAGVLLHKHCHRVRHSWPTWEAAEVDAASNFSRCEPARRYISWAVPSSGGSGDFFSSVIWLDKNITMSNRCFVFECVYVCVFARGAVAWWGWIELGKEGGEGWRWISSGEEVEEEEEEEEWLHVGRKLTDTWCTMCTSSSVLPCCTFLHSSWRQRGRTDINWNWNLQH